MAPAPAGHSIVEKILGRAAGRPVRAGDVATLTVDRAVMLDTTFFFLNQMRREILSVADPDRIVLVFDHEVPAPSALSAAAQSAGRAFAERFGIRRFHDLGRDQGISHVLVSENAHVLPGEVLVGSDSHSQAAGVMNCAARAVTILDLLQAATTGEAWLQLAPTARYDIAGRLSPGVGAMDVFLHLAGQRGDHSGLNLEYGGPGLGSLSIAERRTLATMTTELNADFATFEADDRLLAHVAERADRPFIPVAPDPDAAYAFRHTLELSGIDVMVARPHGMLGNTQPAATTGAQPITQAFIGSCANGSLEDIAAAAQVLKDRRVAPGVRLIVTPASQAIWREALVRGYLAVLAEAGAVVTSATCGACAGGHLGVLGPGDVCVTSSSRNFRGRMGSDRAEIWMSSPATVAASAVAGRICDPRDMLAEDAP
ncbi:aconitase/3-isopropylmalate dehydratase large subunit family protein [Poseidonocella sp. HB161398]|uniref:aconitase/3-isopropylmalate dehydratase large subunit family protein n=1 Tax=Poseidonocella sp. HB161398 TaxID=2320855 RepID=UPI001108BC78|nr:aconitase/3-isopropylmalate dehydratase large subunit family protein [Poseidonocella sp. HB161398]